jgi:PAS domain-containing protein
MRDGVIVLDAHTRIRDINPGALKFLNLTMEKAVGAKASEVIPQCPELRRGIVSIPEFHKQVILGEGSQQQVLSLQVAPLYNRIGMPSGRIVILRDITRQEEQFALAKIPIWSCQRHSRNSGFAGSAPCEIALSLDANP